MASASAAADCSANLVLNGIPLLLHGTTGIPVTRPFCGPWGFPRLSLGFPPEKASALAVNEFLLRRPAAHKRLPSSNSRFSCYPHEIHKIAVVIPRERALSTVVSTM